MITKVKMCGLYRDEDITYVNELQPEFIGFVFYKKSHRYVDLKTADRLKKRLDKNIKAVGVFVNEDIELIKELLDKEIIDIVQLHGSEDDDYIESLKNAANKPSLQIIKAIQIKSKEDLVNQNIKLADYYLLDSGMGSGSSFDWSIIKELDKPIFLAGGLNTDNVTDAINSVKPFAVDVSSGIETDKVKDIEKMRKFISLVRDAK